MVRLGGFVKTSSTTNSHEDSEPGTPHHPAIKASLGCSDPPADKDGLAHGLNIECTTIATSMVQYTQLTGSRRSEDQNDNILIRRQAKTTEGKKH